MSTANQLQQVVRTCGHQITRPVLPTLATLLPWLSNKVRKMKRERLLPLCALFPNVLEIKLRVKLRENRKKNLGHWKRTDSKLNPNMPAGPGHVSRGVRFSKFPKILNLMITELFYSHIPNMNRGSRHRRSFRCLHHSAFR